MAFGGLRGTLTGNGGSIGTSNAITGSVVVSVGDLVVVVFGQQTNLTASGATDNLGNTYSAQNAGTDGGAATGRMFYARVTAAGTLTQVTVAATSSVNDWAGFAGVIEGPFVTSPIDANPSNGSTDVTSPFTCPATGTLNNAFEVVMAWGAANQSTTWAASSPNTLAGNANNASNIKVALGYQTASSTSTVSPEFTAASNPSAIVLGTASFKGQRIAEPTVGTVNATGLAPALTRQFRAAPDVGSAQAAGLAPTESHTTGIIRAPGDGTVNATGLAPTETHTANALAAPGAGTVNATGLAPGLTRNFLFQPGAGGGSTVTWDPARTNANITLSEGNLRISKSSVSTWDNGAIPASVTLPDKGYAEFTCKNTCTHITIGLQSNTNYTNTGHPGTSSALWYLNGSSGALDTNYWSERWTGGDPTTNDVGMMAWDLTQGRIWFGLNGVWLGDGDPTVIPAQFQSARTHSSCTLSENNQRAHFSSTGTAWRATAVQDAVAKGSGQFYFTFKLFDPGSANSNNLLVGICRAADFNKDSMWASAAAWMLNSPGTSVGGGWTYQSGGDYPSNTDYNCVAVDLDAGKIWWGNGGGAFPNSGDPDTGANPQLLWTGTGNASDYDDWIIFVAANDDGGLTLRDVRIYPDETGGYDIFAGSTSMWSWAGAKYHWIHSGDDPTDYDWTIKCGIYGDLAGSGYDGDLLANFGGSAFAYTLPSGFQAVGGTGGGVSVVQAAGAAPSATATANVRHAPGAGTVNATGLAPTAERSYRLAVPAGDAQAVGLAPTARRSFSIPVAAGDVQAVGLAPTESHTAGQTVSPGAGSVTATGLAPDLGRSYRIAVPQGDVVANGYAPTTGGSVVVAIPAGTVTVTGHAPVAGRSYTFVLPSGTVQGTGFAPSASRDLRLLTDAGTLSASGFAPALRRDYLARPAAGSVAATGLAPTESHTFATEIATGAGEIVCAGFAPTVLASIIKTTAPERAHSRTTMSRPELERPAADLVSRTTTTRPRAVITP